MNSVDIDVTTVEPSETDVLAEQWVALARGQREHGSHLEAEANRMRVREHLARYSASDQLLVARVDVSLGGHKKGTEGGPDSETNIVGFVMFRVRSDRYETDRERGLVENLYVAPDWRGQGVGSELLAAAERRLRERGVEAISLEAMAANEAARRFYRRHGYDPHRVEFEKTLDTG